MIPWKLFVDSGNKMSVARREQQAQFKEVKEVETIDKVTDSGTKKQVVESLSQLVHVLDNYVQRCQQTS